MGWVERQHDASEKEVHNLENIEREKIAVSLTRCGQQLKAQEADPDFWEKDHHLTLVYESDEVQGSSYGYNTDWFYLAKQKQVNGRLVKFFKINDNIGKAYKLHNFRINRLFIDERTAKTDRLFLLAGLDTKYYDLLSYESSAGNQICIKFGRKKYLQPWEKAEFQRRKMKARLTFSIPIVGSVEGVSMVEYYAIFERLEQA